MKIARKPAIGLVLAGAAVLVAVAWLQQWRRVRTRPLPVNAPGLAAALMDQVHAAFQLQAAADVVVTRQLDGQLVVTGRAVKDGPLVVASLDELRTVLRRYRQPGIGMALVPYRSSGGVEGLLKAAPAEVEEARRAIENVLVEAGFTAPTATSMKKPSWQGEEAAQR